MNTLYIFKFALNSNKEIPCFEKHIVKEKKIVLTSLKHFTKVNLQLILLKKESKLFNKYSLQNFLINLETQHQEFFILIII